MVGTTFSQILREKKTEGEKAIKRENETNGVRAMRPFGRKRNTAYVRICRIDYIHPLGVEPEDPLILC